MIMGLTESEYALFCKRLKDCNAYFEFGSGYSTLLAESFENISKIVSVDSSSFWIRDISTKLKTNKTEFIHIDINAGSVYGYPQDKSKISNWPNYSQAVLENFDLYFVDGRFRVACCLKVWERMRQNSKLLVHDYKREEYHVIEQFFTKVEQGDGLALFEKKELDDLKPIQDLYEKYKLVSK